MSADELVDIVDENNQVIEVTTRREMRKNQLPHRASYIAVRDRQCRYLVEIRTLCKDYSPGTFDAVVGGVIQHGENVDESAKRELSEEVGIDANDDKVNFYPLGPCKIVGRSGKHFFYAYLYLVISDMITVRQSSEVSGIMLVEESDIERLKDSTAYDSVIAFREILKRAKDKNLV